MSEKIQFGVDYYPEHWNSERIETDIKLMKEMGIDLVRLGEFSWSKLETSDNNFEFGWLKQVVAKFEKVGIKVVLGTPTAAPPAWLIKEHPEIQPVDRESRTRHFGGRHHCCHSNLTYRKYCERYVEIFAEEFSKSTNVIGWQIDNELGNSHNELCYCDSCEKNFQRWLEKKYVTINELNQSWGTTFWSQTYNDFEQIQAPKLTAAGENPSQLLDWKRCHSDLIKDFHDEQVEIIRKYSEDTFITHNMMGFSNVVNYYELAEKLDFVSHDQYPSGPFHKEQNRQSGDHQAAELDVIRGIKQQTFWIMEQQSNIAGWDVLGRLPSPGQISLWTVQSVAHGADTIVYFRWRTSAMGTEQYWHGILPHSGIPGRVYEEIKTLTKEIRPIMQQVNGIKPKSKVAIVYSYDQSYAFDIQHHHPDLNYVDHLRTYYKGLYENNISVDFISDAADFSEYELIVAPLQFILTNELAEKYRNYVQKGGNLILTMRTGVKTESNICYTDSPLPGLLSDVLGIQVPEYDCLLDTEVRIKIGDKNHVANKWADLITLTSAEALASYDSQFYKGTPAITQNDFGKGKAYYVGTEMSPSLMSDFIDRLQIKKEAQAAPIGVEIASRESEKLIYHFVMNHTDCIQSFDPPKHWTLYKDDKGTKTIPEHGYLIFIENK
ncbi:beta-galactosidase [Enterococcus sp. JM4C]|uniref:beta-galactosidase n=1 Tax=Candidatus Enterococcus huntleyi TaxID=1857217 RepID=UPI00137A8E87|nr:beta-galactosidase [Enterococcus sp. JM4C]KAF1299503.1 beta-galactosidase [Enterococcus sp. JM4C]